MRRDSFLLGLVLLCPLAYQGCGGEVGDAAAGSDDGSSSTDGGESLGDSSSAPETGAPDPARCGDGVIDDGEVCDGSALDGQDCQAQGFDGGELTCAVDCEGFDTSVCVMFGCGNDRVEGKEVCDGTDFGGATCRSEGFGDGELVCDANCGGLDTRGCGALCGNGLIEDDEACDDIVGGQTCGGLGFDGGELGCYSNCELDVSGCGQCGNGIVDGDEVCDGETFDGETCVTLGFGSGTLACTPDCATVVSDGCNTCGDGIISGSETCDTALVDANTCLSLGYGGGTLACADDCGSYDFDGCDFDGTCTPWEDLCLEGDRCARFASQPQGWADATECVPIDANPSGVGESCTVQGWIFSGDDDCDRGMYCAGWEWDSQVGYCVETCGGTADDPTCATPGTVCDVQEPVLNLCLPTCDPLAEACPGEIDICEQSNYSDYWVCWPEYDPIPGQDHGAPCVYNNGCDSGFTCVAGDLVDAFGCNGGNQCCTAVCDLTAVPDDCPGDQESCIPYPYYPSGQPAPGYEHVGICAQ